MNLSRRSVISSLAIILSVMVTAACGGGSNPSGPSGSAQGVVLRGNVANLGSLSQGAIRAFSGAATVTVSVAENPAITSVVAPDGSFTLRGLPEGGFTLVFTSNGAELGRLSFTEVKPNQEITVTVSVTAGGVALLEQQRNGIGHGDIEIEGRVEQVVSVSTSGDSRFVINGKTVVARPGQTAIREGNKGRSVTDVTVGRQVHVKGVWMTQEGAVQPVLAHEIKLQGGAESPTEEPSSKCQAAGQKAEVEGIINAKGASSVFVRQNGKGDYQANVTSATSIRKGNTTYTFAQLEVGWRVHVKGTGAGLVGALCVVNADEIKVQNN